MIRPIKDHLPIRARISGCGCDSSKADVMDVRSSCTGRDSNGPPSVREAAGAPQGSDMGFAIGNIFTGPAPDRILGIDPGLRCTGYAVIERTAGGPYLCEGGIIRSTTGRSLAARVQEIGEGVADVIAQYAPTVLTIEQVFMHGQNPKTAILMAHARGAILFAAMSRAVQVVHYTPRQIKKLLTGSGNASKSQMQSAVQREFGLAAPPEPHDVADACASALCHFHSLRMTMRSA